MSDTSYVRAQTVRRENTRFASVLDAHSEILQLIGNIKSAAEPHEGNLETAKRLLTEASR